MRTMNDMNDMNDMKDMNNRMMCYNGRFMCNIMPNLVRRKSGFL